MDARGFKRKPYVIGVCAMDKKVGEEDGIGWRRKKTAKRKGLGNLDQLDFHLRTTLSPEYDIDDPDLQLFPNKVS